MPSLLLASWCSHACVPFSMRATASVPQVKQDVVRMEWSISPMQGALLRLGGLLEPARKQVNDVYIILIPCSIV